jgi:Flp pilus assembly protein TadG
MIRRGQVGNTILEFAIVMCFLIPIFTGMFTIGMALSKGIQVSNVAHDAVVLMVRSNIDPESYLDLSIAQNQSIIVRAAQGLGMNTAGTETASSTGNAVVFLSKVVMVGTNECSLAGLTPNNQAPLYTASNCPNYGSYVFEYRVVIGNTSIGSSKLGNPGGTVASNGTISWQDIASNTSDQDPSFPTVTGMTLLSSNYALVSEMYANVSYLNFFNVMSNPIIYARSIS